MRPDPLILPPELQQSIRDGDCLAYIGSGASAGCYAPWIRLVNDLCTHCGSGRKLTEKSQTEDYLEAAEDAKSKNEKGYYEFLGGHFGRSINFTTPIYRALLSCNFKSYLTVNFDPLLAFEARTAVPVCQNDLMVYPHLDRQHIGKRTLYYLHGYIAEHSVPVNGSIVLSKSEFDRAYEADSPLRTFLLETIREDNICFIGCSLREPVLIGLFNAMKKQQSDRMRLQKQYNQPPSTPPLRYILLANEFKRNSAGDLQIDSEFMDSEDERLKQLGIQVLRYSIRTKDDHSALRLAFENLANMSKIRFSYGWDGAKTNGR